jgi:hypothetical protein
MTGLEQPGDLGGLVLTSDEGGQHARSPERTASVPRVILRRLQPVCSGTIHVVCSHRMGEGVQA